MRSHIKAIAIGSHSEIANHKLHWVLKSNYGKENAAHDVSVEAEQL